MKIGGVNKLPINYDLGGGSLTLFDATTGREVGNLDNVHLDSCEVEKGTQFGSWMRQNTSIIMECSIDEVDAIRKIFELDIPRQTDICDIQCENSFKQEHIKRRE